MLGLGVPWQNGETNPTYYRDTLRLLVPPHWYNWKADALQRDYTPMVWACKHSAWFTAQIERAQAWRNEYSFYFIGNEPERPEQSNTSPHEFAAAMQTWLALVGGQWAGPGVLWGDPGRAWLAEYLRIGGPLPDVWAIHIYGSTTVQGWLDQYTDAAIWLDRRVSVRPIWVTETNGSEAIMRYLAARHDVIAFWYCAHDPFGNNRAADLTNANATSLTDLGRLYVSLQGVGGAGAEQHKRYMPFMAG